MLQPYHTNVKNRENWGRSEGIYGKFMIFDKIFYKSKIVPPKLKTVNSFLISK